MTAWLERSRAMRADVPIVSIATIARPSGAIVTIDTVGGTTDLAQPRMTGDEIDERAAIVQEGAKVPIDWADGFAQLEARPTPPWVSPPEWLSMINAAGRFLDQWGGKAAALGWSAGELFGLDEVAPMNRLDRRGAAFFLARAEVVAITAAEITIRLGNTVQRIQRREGLAAPGWEATA